MLKENQFTLKKLLLTAVLFAILLFGLFHLYMENQGSPINYSDFWAVGIFSIMTLPLIIGILLAASALTLFCLFIFGEQSFSADLAEDKEISEKMDEAVSKYFNQIKKDQLLETKKNEKREVKDSQSEEIS